eukprot:1897705-Rhodomonas_salina.1
MSVVDPTDLSTEQIEDFPKHCKRLAKVWSDAYTANYMKSFYLHQIMMHAPALWQRVVVEL